MDKPTSIWAWMVLVNIGNSKIYKRIMPNTANTAAIAINLNFQERVSSAIAQKYDLVE
jgi:hypothetical protein